MEVGGSLVDLTKLLLHSRSRLRRTDASLRAALELGEEKKGQVGTGVGRACLGVNPVGSINFLGLGLYKIEPSLPTPPVLLLRYIITCISPAA